MATQTNTRTRNARNGNNNGKAGVQISAVWPQERWIGAIILTALGLLILIRMGFRGVGVSLGATGRVSV